MLRLVTQTNKQHLEMDTSKLFRDKKDVVILIECEAMIKNHH